MRTESQEYKGWLREYRWFLLLEVLLAASIFYVDLSQELGVTAGVLYVSLVLVALWARQKRYVWGAAVLGTLLTVLGYWLSPPGGEFWKVVLNRVISLLVIWATAFLCYLFKINEETLEEAHGQLEDQLRSLAKKDAELEFSNRRLEEKVEERTQKLKATNLFLEREVKKNLQANRALESAHQSLATILTSAGVGVYGLDLKGNTTFCNLSAASMMGYDIEEILGQNQHELIHHSRPDGSSYPQRGMFCLSGIQKRSRFSDCG